MHPNILDVCSTSQATAAITGDKPKQALLGRHAHHFFSEYRNVQPVGYPRVQRRFREDGVCLALCVLGVPAPHPAFSPELHSCRVGAVQWLDVACPLCDPALWAFFPRELCSFFWLVVSRAFHGHAFVGSSPATSVIVPSSCRLPARSACLLVTPHPCPCSSYWGVPWLYVCRMACTLGGV